MRQLTLNELKEEVDKLVRKGYGDRYLIASDDNEGNGYHGMFYAVTPGEEALTGDEFINDTNFEDPYELVVVG